ncbi:MAG TPA: LEPR-XLL domain-containing protein, partial [Limnobacter sp.]|nr:LEPR-XLL domain-containing protein [Limnobacter sp.]
MRSLKSNSTVKSDRADRKPSFGFSTLVSAVKQTLRRSTGTKSMASVQASPIKFDPIEPRILLSADLNPTALSIQGSIDVQGEQDVYQFTVEEPRRVVFDSLTSRNDLNWRLDGPNGQVTARTFSATDWYASTTAFELEPGTYQITADGTQDALGAYALRIIDAEAATPLTLNEPVQGQLPNGNETAVYKFQAQAKQRLYFDASASNFSPTWRLIDPFGRQILGPTPLSNGNEVAPLAAAGEYLLLIEGIPSANAVVTYDFTLHAVQDQSSTLVFGEQANAVINQKTQAHHFNFSVSELTQVVLNPLVDSGRLNQFLWTLKGPNGSVFPYNYLSQNVGQLISGRAFIALLPGDYTLSVRANGESLGELPFNVLTDKLAQPISLDAVVQGTLSQANLTKIFSFEVQAGQSLSVEGLEQLGATFNWRLADPFGRIVLQADGLMQSLPAWLVEASGRYTLTLETRSASQQGQPQAYSFRVNRVVHGAQNLPLNTPINGRIEQVGQLQQYKLDLSADGQFVFDALSNRADIRWDLYGPAGEIVSNRRFDQSDGTVSGSTMLNLSAGQYRLVVEGVGAAKGDFAFQFLDASQALVYELGQDLSGTLNPGRGSLLYQFESQPGDVLELENTSTVSGQLVWRLVDRYGRNTFDREEFARNKSNISLLVGGRYTLVLEGLIGNNNPVDFGARLNRVSTQQVPALADGEQYEMGTTVAGTFNAWNDTKTYRFALTEDATLVFDTLNANGSSAVWSLVGPRGLEVDARHIDASDAQNSLPVYRLPAGNYALTVKGARNNGGLYSSGSYSFRLLNPNLFSDLGLGQVQSVTRSPGNSTLGYRFQASAGDRLVLNTTQSMATSWRIVDEHGNALAVAAGGAVGTTYQVLRTGMHYLLSEGFNYIGGNANVTINLGKESLLSKSLSFNDLVSEVLPDIHSLQQFKFRLDQPQALVFDAVNTFEAGANQVQWRLRNLVGDVVGWTAFSNEQGGLAGGMFLPGEYVLEIRNTVQQAFTAK